MIWNVTVPMLGAAVIYLVWRVWRLEQRATRNEAQDSWLHECLMERAHKSSVLAISERVAGDLDAVKQLATALGYEWKRTEAKEGWEKKNPFGIGDLYTYRRAMVDALMPREYDWTLPTTDRRKADRRKPTPQAAPKSPPKKSRRATH